MKTASTNSVESSARYQGKNLPPIGGNKISAENRKGLPEAFSITQEEFTLRIRDVMLADVGGDPGATKRLARKLGCSIGTAKNYLEGRSTPQGLYDLRAIAKVPGYLSAKTQMAGVGMTIDPVHQAKVADFMRYCADQAGELFGAQQ